MEHSYSIANLTVRVRTHEPDARLGTGRSYGVDASLPDGSGLTCHVMDDPRPALEARAQNGRWPADADSWLVRQLDELMRGEGWHGLLSEALQAQP